MTKINQKNFKKTLSKFATGITIICVKNNEITVGKTVNSFNSLSLDPPLVLFSLGKNSSSINDFINTKFLSINILSKKQKNLSLLFSEKKIKLNKLKFIKGKNKTSIIPDCVANLECKVNEIIKKGDHFLFICKIVNSYKNDDLKPLIYFNSNYY